MLTVSHHLQDENFRGRVAVAGNQPVLVAADVEDHAVTYDACAVEGSFDISPRSPHNALAVDVRIPCPEWPFGLLVARSLPELLQASLGDDASARTS